jgi:peptidoglycan/xylan/chitin deacetylase (PgdA/CDA1 family)
MYREQPYTGEELPLKSLCLTYDDGPGENTFEIAKFLHEENIRATFFVVGKYAIENEEILEKVARLEHLIGNHTYEHPDMPYYLSKNGDVQNQVLRTDALIKKYNKKSTIYFRSPYGKWSGDVANELNSNLLTAINHVGPIHWDIAGIDCFYWKNNVSIKETVEKYLTDIEKKGKGIIVMHDEIADMNFLKPKNQTLELTKQLIPILKAKGYKFVRLDEIKSIKENGAKELLVNIKTKRGKYLHVTEGTSITTNENDVKLNRNFVIQDLGEGRFSLRDENGMFLSSDSKQDKTIGSYTKEVSSTEMFDLVPLYSNKFLVRADSGYFLQVQKSSGRLAATAEFMRGGEIFTILPVGHEEKKTYSITQQIEGIRRQLMYVKSKIKQAI